MRWLLLAAVLASACDQGATAAPAPPIAAPLEVAAPIPPPPIHVRYVVQGDADFVAKASAVLGEMSEIFADGSKDCDLVATRVEEFGARNVTRFGVLTEYGRAHPTAQTKLSEQFKPQTDKLIAMLMPLVTACSGNARLMTSFQKLAENGQLQQRPR